MKLKLVFILLHLVCVQISLAQTATIKGNVFDSQNRKALSGVTIKVGSQATKTDRNGYFEINTPLKTVTELGINFSHIGFLSVNLIYQPQHIYQVYMTENSAGLREVLIAPGDDIIKKAIKKIPENYPDKPTMIKGILRIQKLRNNSQYFRSDAVIKAYVPPYTSSEKTKVTVLANQLDTIYDKTLKYIRNVDSYNVVEFADVAHRKELLLKLLKKKKFDYRLTEKQIYNGHNVFVINSVLLDTAKNYNRLEVTFYIDTATYAFVASRLAYYDIPRLGPFIPRKEAIYQAGYEKIGQKWYLAEAHYKGIAVYKDEEPHTTSDFIRTELDTLNVKELAYKDVVQKMDDVLVIDKPANQSDQKISDSLFKKFEKIGKIKPIPLEKLDTIKSNNINASINYRKPFGRKIYDYIRSDNIRGSFGIYKLPFELISTAYNVPESITYGIGSCYSFRLYRNVFLKYEYTSNFYNRKKIKLSTTAIDLVYDLIMHTNHRELIFNPFVGYQLIDVKFEGKIKNYNTINFGLRTSYEVTHKVAPFAAINLNPSLKDYRINTLTISPTGYSAGIGIIIKM